MEMTYSESAKGITITKARAFTELRKHGFSSWECRADMLTELGDHGFSSWECRADMLTELGDHDTYLASDVLAWLGY